MSKPAVAINHRPDEYVEPDQSGVDDAEAQRAQLLMGLEAYLNSQTPQVLTAGSNSDAATVAILGAQSAASPSAWTKGWLEMLEIDRALTNDELANTIRLLADNMGVALV